MLKQMLLIGAAAVSFPALAQTAEPAGEPTPPASEPAPAPTDSTPPSDDSAPSDDQAPDKDAPADKDSKKKDKDGTEEPAPEPQSA